MKVIVEIAILAAGAIMIGCIAVIAIQNCAPRQPDQPDQWIGIDRSTAACDRDEWRKQTCVAGGRRFLCLLGDDSFTWQCAEMTGATPVEAP